MSNKRLPAWYKLFIIKQIEKREIALTLLDKAELALANNYPQPAKRFIERAKQAVK